MEHFPAQFEAVSRTKKSADDIKGPPGRALPSATKQLIKRGND
jgi:hypothetical protein